MSRRILVIDDDALVRDTIVQMLSDRGFVVSTAMDGEHGLRLFREHPPDLVVTDIVMPVKEGLQTIKELRRMRPGAKIVALSGGGHAGRHDFLELAQELGAWELIAKPFDPDDFLARIDRCFGT